MINKQAIPYATFILRVTLGGLLVAHASAKLLVFAPAGTAQFFAFLGDGAYGLWPVRLTGLLGSAAKRT